MVQCAFMWKEPPAKPPSPGEKGRSISFAEPSRRHKPGWVWESVRGGLTRHRRCVILGPLHCAHAKVSLRHRAIAGAGQWSHLQLETGARDAVSVLWFPP